MTERPRDAGLREAESYRLGRSHARWEGDALVLEVVERAVPHLTPIRGRIRLIPEAVNLRGFALDAAGRHRWRPIAPSARVEVDMPSPGLSWRGAGYLDCNWGDEPLEAGFRRWDWSRAALPEGSAVLYDAARRDGTALSLALRFGRDGTAEETPPPLRAALPTTLWRVARGTRTEDGAPAREVRRLEDAPFYARAEIETRLFGARAHAVHETFDGDRFATGWVKALLPFRMPRAPRRR